jgi:hypothetical protein
MNRSYSKIRHIQESNQRLERRLLNEQVTLNDYVNAFNSIITPWMTNMDSKLKSQGFKCINLGGDENCDENLYGFKLFNDYGVEKHKYWYYFPYETGGLNLKLYKNENDDSDVYFEIYMRNKVLGNFGKGAKTVEEINKAANDAINTFDSYANRSYSSMYPD